MSWSDSDSGEDSDSNDYLSANAMMEEVEEDDHSENDFGSDSDLSSDETFTLKEELLACLDAVNAAGTFASFYIRDEFPNPGLFIKGYGAIPFPLQSRDADAIAQMSRQAPFGKGDKTVVDTTVRNTWELDSSSLEFRNPAWVEFLKQIIQRTKQELGIEGSISAELYKLLLYEQGAFFKAHKDTEKAPGMIGTLVICLPSKHEGGDVHLSHSGGKKVLQSGPTSEYGLSVLAWYSDVTHEVKPITSGHRLVVTYNIVQTSANLPKQSAAHLADQADQLGRALKLWRRNYLETNPHSIYILEHKYTSTSLKLASLKGRDQAVGAHLQQVCSANGFYLFLAAMERSVTEENDYYDGEDKEDDLCLRDIVTPSGISIGTKLEIEMDDILQQDPFERDPDAESDGEFTGNESAPATLRYHDTVSNWNQSSMWFYASHHFAGCSRHPSRVLV